MTCEPSGCQVARVYSLIRPLRTGFAVDRFAVEVGNGGVVTVVFAVGDALGDARRRPARVVMRLVFGQDGTQVPLAEDRYSRHQARSRWSRRRVRLARDAQIALVS